MLKQVQHDRSFRHPELRERRLKADKMLQWSILSESPSGCAAKGQGSIYMTLQSYQNKLCFLDMLSDK